MVDGNSPGNSAGMTGGAAAACDSVSTTGAGIWN